MPKKFETCHTDLELRGVNYNAMLRQSFNEHAEVIKAFLWS